MGHSVLVPGGHIGMQKSNRLQLVRVHKSFRNRMDQSVLVPSGHADTQNSNRLPLVCVHKSFRNRMDQSVLVPSGHADIQNSNRAAACMRTESLSTKLVKVRSDTPAKQTPYYAERER